VHFSDFDRLTPQFFKKKSSKAAYNNWKMRQFLVRFKKRCELLQQFASDKVWSDKLSELVLFLFWFLYISSCVQTNYFENLLKLLLRRLFIAFLGKISSSYLFFWGRLCATCEGDSACTPSGSASAKFICPINFSDKMRSDTPNDVI
jgi:hypothetical protein